MNAPKPSDPVRKPSIIIGSMANRPLDPDFNRKAVFASRLHGKPATRRFGKPTKG
jgi:hypothetical protein